MTSMNIPTSFPAQIGISILLFRKERRGEGRGKGKGKGETRREGGRKE